LLSVRGSVVDDQCGWSYVTVLAAAPAVLPVGPVSGESDDVRWIPEARVGQFPLHPRLAQMWPRLRGALDDADSQRR